MPIPAYEKGHPVDCDVAPNLATLKSKSVVVTGGANGLGEGYVRAFADAGAFITFGDINEKKGKEIEAELSPWVSCPGCKTIYVVLAMADLGSNVQFVKCDTTSWTDQLHMFKQAVANSPDKSCDVVIANAGVSGADELFALEDPKGEPTEPKLRILQINLIGAIYTLKLAMHYFRTQPEADSRDRCFIFKGSIAGLLDQPGSWQYSTSKFGLRGLMRTARRTSWSEGIRVNLVAPWYTQTTIMSAAVVERLTSKGVEFSLREDCTAAMIRIATDKTINGRTLAIVPRSQVARGFMDPDMDDEEAGSFWDRLQDRVLGASIRTVIPANQQ